MKELTSDEKKAIALVMLIFAVNGAIPGSFLLYWFFLFSDERFFFLGGMFGGFVGISLVFLSFSLFPKNISSFSRRLLTAVRKTGLIRDNQSQISTFLSSMGIYIFQTEGQFFIPKENFQAVTNVLRGLVGQGTNPDPDGPHFAFVDPVEFALAESIEEFFAAWRWDVFPDENGNITSIEFFGEKLGDDDIFFRTIAPFVAAGSYIQMIADNGSVWKWCFDGETMQKKIGRVVFD